MNANPETTVTQPPSANKLASFGKFWQGMTSGSQDDSSQPTSRRTTVSCQLSHQCLPRVSLACLFWLGLVGHGLWKYMMTVQSLALGMQQEGPTLQERLKYCLHLFAISMGVFSTAL